MKEAIFSFVAGAIVVLVGWLSRARMKDEEAQRWVDLSKSVSKRHAEALVEEIETIKEEVEGETPESSLADRLNR